MHGEARAVRLSGTGSEAVVCRVAEEAPVGLLYNGFGHAVVMATPCDLEDLAIGYALTDGVCDAQAVLSVTRRDGAQDIQLDAQLSAPAFADYLARRRRRSARVTSSCGVCGIEELDEVPRAAGVIVPSPIDRHAIRRALAALPSYQGLNAATGAAHAAAWASVDGEILLVREDVGRHNALDKLIGARARGAVPEGFCVLTSRCSYEMVQKSAAAGIGLVVCISAPTTLAITVAARLGVGLVAMARGDSQMIYAGAAQLTLIPGDAAIAEGHTP